MPYLFQDFIQDKEVLVRANPPISLVSPVGAGRRLPGAHPGLFTFGVRRFDGGRKVEVSGPRQASICGRVAHAKGHTYCGTLYLSNEHVEASSVDWSVSRIASAQNGRHNKVITSVTEAEKNTLFQVRRETLKLLSSEKPDRGMLTFTDLENKDC